MRLYVVDNAKRCIQEWIREGSLSYQATRSKEPIQLSSTKPEWRKENGFLFIFSIFVYKIRRENWKSIRILVNRVVEFCERIAALANAIFYVHDIIIHAHTFASICERKYKRIKSMVTFGSQLKKENKTSSGRTPVNNKINWNACNNRRRTFNSVTFIVHWARLHT